METKMSDKKLVDFIEEYIDDSELLSELADVRLDDIRLNVERRELELLCSAAAAPGELLLRAVETSLIKAFTLNAAMINCSVTEEKPEEAPKEPMSETGLAKLLLSLRREFPAANGFLNDAQCFILGDTVSVQLKSGADVINNLGASKRFAQMIFERFGEDVTTAAYDMTSFRAFVNVELSPTFYGWVFGFGGKVQILSPAKAKDQ